MIQNLSRSSYNHPCNPASWSCIGRTQGKPNCTTKISVASGLFRFVRRQLPLVSHNLYCNWNVSFPFFLWKVKRISSHACTTAFSFEATQLTGLQLKRMIRSKMLVPICSFLHDQKCSFDWCFFPKIVLNKKWGKTKGCRIHYKRTFFFPETCWKNSSLNNPSTPPFLGHLLHLVIENELVDHSISTMVWCLFRNWSK